MLSATRTDISRQKREEASVGAQRENIRKNVSFRDILGRESVRVQCPKCEKLFSQSTITKYHGLCGTCHNDPLKVACSQCFHKYLPQSLHHGICRRCEAAPRSRCIICAHQRLLTREGICSDCYQSQIYLEQTYSHRIEYPRGGVNVTRERREDPVEWVNIITISPSDPPKVKPKEKEKMKMKTIKFERMTNNKCTFCLMEFKNEDDISIFPRCFHYFHKECSEAWVNQNESCPLCRERLD